MNTDIKILCYINHYFGPSSVFIGKSTSSSNSKRESVVKKVVENILRIPNTDVFICGVPGSSLVPLDIEFSNLSDSRNLIFESLNHMLSQRSEYDYFLNIEDDIACNM